jgi:hypothetical protein
MHRSPPPRGRARALVLGALFAAASGAGCLAQSSRPETRRGSIAGRCVRAEDGSPVAGASATLRLRWRDGSVRLAFGELPVPELTRVRTGDDGRFALVLPPIHGLVGRLEVEADARAPRATALGEGESLDLGDLALLPTREVKGRVLDADGKGNRGAAGRSVPPARHRRGGGLGGRVASSATSGCGATAPRTPRGASRSPVACPRGSGRSSSRTRRWPARSPCASLPVARCRACPS